jgi:Xaa-Pro aminopeptidase
MKSIITSHAEATGERFEIDRYLKARHHSWLKLEELHQFIENNFSSLSEEDIHNQIKSVFGNQIKYWHPHKVRFKENTRCSFRDISEPNKTLQKGDHYLIDLGPIIDGHEADVGQTYRVGFPQFENPAQSVFKTLEKIWLEQGITGEELYSKAIELGQQYDCELNQKMTGHRLGDFPHALFHRGGLNEFDQSPKEMLWVLEIHLIHKTQEIGFFYEDILGAPSL